jgi:uncharacterized membrane protein
MPAPAPRRAPIFVCISGLMPLAGFIGMYLINRPAPEPHYSSGGWGLGEIFLFVAMGVLGVALGFVAVAIAVLRRERWVPLQWVMGLFNLGSLLLAAAALTGQFRR